MKLLDVFRFAPAILSQLAGLGSPSVRCWPAPASSDQNVTSALEMLHESPLRLSGQIALTDAPT
jgi:hypothetical protein